MKYEVMDSGFNGRTITACPYYPDIVIGTVKCALCKHWQSPGSRIGGVEWKEPGISIWELGCAKDHETHATHER